MSQRPRSIPPLWQLLIGFKLVLLVSLWLALDDSIHFGDMPLFADAGEAGKDAKDASEPKAGRDSKESKDDKDAKGSGAGAKATADKDSSTADAAGEEKGGSKARKSFLANLLELPPLNPDSMKKEELGRYLEVAERKKSQVEERLASLGRREEQLKGLESAIDQKLKHLDEERRYFAQTIQDEKKLKGERLDKLVPMYAKMEPKKAAPIMEKLDKDLVMELFKQLPQKQITAILEVMTPDKSVALSEYFGRVRSTREYDVLKEMNESLRKEFDDCKGMGKAAP